MAKGKTKGYSEHREPSRWSNRDGDEGLTRAQIESRDRFQAELDAKEKRNDCLMKGVPLVIVLIGAILLIYGVIENDEGMIIAGSIMAGLVVAAGILLWCALCCMYRGWAKAL